LRVVKERSSFRLSGLTANAFYRFLFAIARKKTQWQMHPPIATSTLISGLHVIR
jgi:hypothetical protein